MNPHYQMSPPIPGYQMGVDQYGYPQGPQDPWSAQPPIPGGLYPQQPPPPGIVPQDWNVQPPIPPPNSELYGSQSAGKF